MVNEEGVEDEDDICIFLFDNYVYDKGVIILEENEVIEIYIIIIIIIR